MIIVVLAAASTGGWVMLYRWYGLFENRNRPHFSFEKIEGGFDSPIMRQTALIFLALAVAFGAAILLLRSMRSAPPLARLGIVALATGPAIINVVLFPVGALDVFNYMTELKLTFHYGENPYLVTFERYESDPFAKYAFLTDITLFYGPAWLLGMWLPTAVSGFDNVIDTLLALKVFNAGLLAVSALMIAKYQRDQALRWLAAALFIANPLVLFEGIANVHNEVLLTLFVTGAMLALQRRSTLAGPLLALSALVKLYTVALVPIFVVVALKERWGWRRVAGTVLLSAFVVAITCAPYWGDGELVAGLRSGLKESQEMDHVSLLSLANQYAQEQEAQESFNTEFVRSRPAFEIVPEETMRAIRNGFTAAFAVITLLIAASVWKGRRPELAAAETLLVLFLLMTNLYPWYLIPVVALLALWPDRLSRIYVIGATGLALVYYPMFIYGHYTSDWTRFQIHQFLALFLTVPILLYLAARAIGWRRDIAR